MELAIRIRFAGVNKAALRQNNGYIFQADANIVIGVIIRNSSRNNRFLLFRMDVNSDSLNATVCFSLCHSSAIFVGPVFDRKGRRRIPCIGGFDKPPEVHMDFPCRADILEAVSDNTMPDKVHYHRASCN